MQLEYKKHAVSVVSRKYKVQCVWGEGAVLLDSLQFYLARRRL